MYIVERRVSLKRLLLLMPSFMGYEKSLKEQLEKKYEVTWLDCDQYDEAILKEYKRCGKFRWLLRNVSLGIKEHDQEKIETKYLARTLEKVNTEKNYYSVVFCINGSFLSDEFYRVLKEKNPHARFIYYAWDDIKNLIKQSHIRFFDERFAYNIAECNKYKYEYCPMFVQNEVVGHGSKDLYDILFIGTAHSDRQKIANELYLKYGEKYRLFIYLYDPAHTNGRFCYDRPLKYEEYIEYMRKSKALIDVPQTTQEGPTTRSFDALLTKTKVITVNPHIKEYPIYSDNILIVDRDDIMIDEGFIEKPYIETGYHALTVPEWLNNFNI